MKIYSKVWITVLALAIMALAMYANLTIPPTRAAGPWYVAPGGDDSLNDCLSDTTPCATINGAIAKATSGDEIRVIHHFFMEGNRCFYSFDNEFIECAAHFCYCLVSCFSESD